MGHYLLKDAPKTGTGDLLISVQAVKPVRIPIMQRTIMLEFSKLLKELYEKRINHKIFDLYGLSLDEQYYIEQHFM